MAGDQRPLVSVIMAMRDAARTLPAALESLRRQEYPHWELLLVDDGSSDESIAIARAFADDRMRLFADRERRGLAFRLNEAVDAARGELIARMDADDICYPERFSRQVRFLQAHPEVDLVGSSAVVFSGEGVAVGLLPVRASHEEICARPWAGFYLPHPTWMGQSRWFRAYRYDVRALKAQDQVLLVRTYACSRFAGIEEPLLGYRQDRVSLRKALIGRWYFSRALMHLPASQAAMAVTAQGMKAFIDAFAIASGLERRLLRHRARPMRDELYARWNSVWQSVSSATIA